MRKLTIEDIILKFILKHGDRYDYSLVVYINSQTKVDIVCRKHGIFKQTPTNHLSGQGCPVCGNTQTGVKNTNTIDSFIKKSNIKHNNIYDYSLVVYTKSHNKVKIICPIHGIFEQTPAMHIQGQGCPVCGDICRRSTTEQFKEKSNKIHNFKYDYSLVIYTGNGEKVKIICPIHGIFEQTPHGHLNGRGCSECSGNKKKNFKYFLENLTIEEDPKEIGGDIYCKCAYCKNYFKPSRSQLISRIKSLIGKEGGEHRLYCSDTCKYLCPIFKQKITPKYFKPDTSRLDQPELREMVLERDNNQCQRCGSGDNLHCHHITGVEINPIESADIDNCITLCNNCHLLVHSDNGCHYSDFKRQPCII